MHGGGVRRKRVEGEWRGGGWRERVCEPRGLETNCTKERHQGAGDRSLGTLAPFDFELEIMQSAWLKERKREHT